mgnify:CR=1 FL=1
MQPISLLSRLGLRVTSCVRVNFGQNVSKHNNSFVSVQYHGITPDYSIIPSVTSCMMSGCVAAALALYVRNSQSYNAYIVLINLIYRMTGMLQAVKLWTSSATLWLSLKPTSNKRFCLDMRGHILPCLDTVLTLNASPVDAYKFLTHKVPLPLFWFKVQWSRVQMTIILVGIIRQ